MRGALELAVAWAAGCQHDDATAWRHLRGPAEAADRLGEDNLLWTVFGPTSVAIHGVVIAADLGEPAEALRRAEPSRLTSTQSQRWSGVSAFHWRRASAQLLRDD